MENPIKWGFHQLRGMTQCVIIGTQPHDAAQRQQSNEQKHGKTEFQQALLFWQSVQKTLHVKTGVPLQHLTVKSTQL